MSAIAKVLHGRGDHVTGSDRATSPYSVALEALGIKVANGHTAANIGMADLVLASSAVPADNVELVAAQEQGVPVMRRDEFLPELTLGYDTIAVAGTHGKTTTSGLIAWLLLQADLDPSFMVGGILRDLETNARTGASAYFVIEADEYDRAFLGLTPAIAVVTNVEHDHPDCYPSMDQFREAFQQFASKVLGTLVVCQDDPGARGLRSSAPRRITYGMDPQAEWRAEELRANTAGGSDFLVIHAGETLGLARTRLPGLHNVRNVLGALAAISAIGVTFRDVREALTEYQGIGRRFQVLGTAAGITVIDDYAHHPSEIKATLQAVRQRYPDADVWAVFQPHTYSRIRTLLDDFALCFDEADHVIVTDVFAAREQPDPDFSGEVIAGRIKHPHVQFEPVFETAASMLQRELGAGSVVITLSAGDGNLVGTLLLEKIGLNEGEKDHG
jgi:UDP-N-acetylmuramate--alanine ligase